MRATWLTTVANIDWPLSYTVGEEAQKKELEVQIKENTDLCKELMESKLLEEVECGEYTVRWTATAASRFDTTTFKKEHEELYMQYLKPSTSKRFSIK